LFIQEGGEKTRRGKRGQKLLISPKGEKETANLPALRAGEKTCGWAMRFGLSRAEKKTGRIDVEEEIVQKKKKGGGRCYTNCIPRRGADR